jgi:aminoglycoside phosphotransferase (APT) family kinase protein
VDAVKALEGVRRHHGIDVVVGDRCVGGEVGAYFARLGDATVVFKWSDRPERADDWARAVERVERLRAIGYPAPRYYAPFAFPGGVVVMQEAVPGSSQDQVGHGLVESIAALNRVQEGGGVAGPWSELMAMSLTEGCDGWCMHGPLGRHSKEGARLLDEVEAVGRDVPCLPTGDVVHNDFHHRNVLRVGDRLSAVVDWEGCTDGDRRLDLVTFAFGLLVARVPGAVETRLWEHLRSQIPHDHLTVYVAHMALRLADWRVRHHSTAAADEAIAFGRRRLDQFL